MAGFDETPILELGSVAIAGGAPCGAEVPEDEEYIFLQQEIAKLDRIEAGEPDWHQIEQAATSILRSKSKDFDIASILGHCLFKRYRYAGLAASLKLLADLATNFWDGAFPERPRRRKARIEALTDRFADGGWFRESPPTSDDFDAVDLCATRISELDAALKARMPDEPPEFAAFLRGIRELAGRRPRAGEPAAAAPGSTPAGSAPGGGGFVAGEMTDGSSAVNAVLSAVTFLRKADPTDPLPYALIRSIKWSRIALPSTDAARHQIEPPERTLVETLEHQFNGGLWENLLKNAEAAFRTADPLWLDVQRYVCTAMARLGASYDRARLAVVAGLSGLVGQLGEGLYDLSFRNGTPLCGGETRLWIETEVCAPKSSPGSSVTAGDGKLTETSDKARKLAAEGKVREAVEQLREGLVACTERRDRFLWRLATAKLCYDSQRLQLALPLLEECREDIERYHIDEWEPSLALEVAGHLYRCRKALLGMEKDPSREARQGVRDSFAWLCQLDPLAALSAEPSGS